MVVIGMLYLIFEDFVLADFSSARKAQLTKTGAIGRILAGAQVRLIKLVFDMYHAYQEFSQIGLIVLSMLVTRSSALSLQAKQGLPGGNQAVGWIVLGTYRLVSHRASCIFAVT